MDLSSDPRTHIKLGMVACISNPRALTVRCVMETGESPDASKPGIPVCTPVNRDPFSHKVEGKFQRPSCPLTLCVLEMAHTCSPNIHTYEREHSQVSDSDDREI